MQNEALYRSLYSKYAPNLTAGELEKKLKYAYTLDPNEFINAFYKKYTGGPPTAKQSEYISSIIGTKSPRKDLIYTKPKNSQQAIESVKNIRGGIDRNDPDVINDIAKEYFNLDNLPKKYKTVHVHGHGQTNNPMLNQPRQVEQEPLEEDIKNYFERLDNGERTGDFTKYEQYKEYQRTKKFNLDWVDNTTISRAVLNRKRQVTEQYIMNIDNDEVRDAAEIAAEEEVFSIFEPWEKKQLNKYIELLKDDRLLKKQYDKDVRKFGLTNPYAEKEESLAGKFLSEYLESKYSDLEADTKDFDGMIKDFELLKTKRESELKKISEELKTLNADHNSSPEDIAKHNELAKKHQDLMAEFEDKIKIVPIRRDKLLERYKKYQNAINVATESDAVAKAFALNYNNLQRMGLHLEKAIVGDFVGWGIGVVNFIASGVETVHSHRVKPIGASDDLLLTDELQDFHANHINYTESLERHMQSSLPEQVAWRDVSMDNIGEVSGQLFADNSFSILSALTYGGAVARISRAGTKIAGYTIPQATYTIPQATRALTQTFFTVEAGAKLSQMEIAQKNAAENIAILEKALPSARSQDERLQILELISEQDKALNVTQVQKAFSSVMYGGIAAYAELLGTLGYVRRLNTMIDAVGKRTWKDALRGAGAFGFNSGIEYVEEFVTQVGHNLVDVSVLDQNKSLLSGIDAKFNMNVLFSTFAIQAPSTSVNIYNAVRNEVMARKDIAKSRRDADELISVLNLLTQETDGEIVMSEADKITLTERRNELLAAAGVSDSYLFARAAQLTNEEVLALFEAQAKKRDEINALHDIGAAAAGEQQESTITKNRRKKHTANLNKIDHEIDNILRKPEERNQETLEQVLGKENVEASDAFYFGKYKAAAQIGKGLGPQQVFKDDIVDGEVVEGSGIAKLETFLNEQLKNKKIGLEEKSTILEGVKKGNYAFYIGNTVVLMEDNIIRGINSATSDLARSVVAYAPFHELQHINDVATGLVKDGNVIESQRAVVLGIEDHIENLYKRNKIDQKEYELIRRRINQYTKNNGGNVNLKELLTIAGELKDAGVLSQESRNPLLSLKILLNKFIRRNFSDNEMFFKLKDTEQVLQYIDSFQRGARASRLMLGPEEETKKVNFSEVYQNVEAMYNEEAWADPKKRSDLALQMAYTLIPEVTRRMQNVNLDETTKEDIAIDFATHEKRGLFGLIKKYDKEVNDSVMGYLNSFVTTPKGKFKLFDLRLQEFYQADPRYGEVIQSMEQEGVSAQVAKLTDETNLENALEDDTKKPKTDVLKVGKVAAKEQDIIEAVNEKGDFRNVIDNNVGTVGNIIFNIPAEKIADPTKNITTSDKIISPKTGKPVKKGEKGILEPSEAKSIQDHFADVNTTKKFIQLLNETNVTEKDADINKVGENIDVSRDVYGRAIGLPRRILDYFYRPKFKSDGKRVRSQGKTSQVPIWELKPEFRGLNDEQLTKAAEQFQKDLGITGKQQVNKLPTKADRSKIGQLLKGAAVVVSQQASLSAAQRKLEAAKAEKQRIADITAAQPKTAFSEVLLGGSTRLDKPTRAVEKMWNYSDIIKETLYQVDEEFIDMMNRRDGKNLLEYHGQKPMITRDSETNVDLYIKEAVDVSIKLNQELAHRGIYLHSDRTVPASIRNKVIFIESLNKSMTVLEYYKLKINEVFPAFDKSTYGKPLTGPAAEYKKNKEFKNLFGEKPSDFRKAMTEPRPYHGRGKNQIKKTIPEINEIHASMGEQLWQIIHDDIKEGLALKVPDRTRARKWMTYLSLATENVTHPQRQWVEFLAWSMNPVGSNDYGDTNPNSKGYKVYEWEHAMQSAKAANYLMHSILGGYNFDATFELIQNNYKLIALDNYDDKVKLSGSKRTHSMGEGYTIFDPFTVRYFHEIVAAVKDPRTGKDLGGIDPNGLMTIYDKTMADLYNINAEGKPRPLKIGAEKNTKLAKPVQNSRKSSFSEVIQGMSAWDFDDTVARTKSGVRYTMPNPTGDAQPGRKVIFLAGGAGSGKSNVVKQLGLVDQGFKVVNSDISLEWLKKNSGLPADMKDLTPKQLSQLGKLQWEARKIATRKQMKFQGQGDGVVIDGTGASINVMNKQVQEFKDKGYDVQMIFVETSLETALARNKARKERTLKESIVIKNHEKVQGNKEGFRELFGNNFAEVKTDNLKIGDPMPSSLTTKLDKFTKGYIKGRLTAEEFAERGASILEQGGEFDFVEFDVVTQGEQGPLFGKAMDRAKKYGLKDNYILTARPHAAKKPIYEFLKSQGLEIPLDNIITLENSTSEAKSLWIAEKIGEGYNDVYFADDHLENVQAVQNMLDQFDVKGKTQQAKISFSEAINQEFNEILENVTGIDAKKRFSAIKARKRGANKGKFRLFIPPSHEDFVGIIYNFLGKGKKGNAHRDFFEKALIRPLNRAYRELNTARQSIANDYKSLKKEYKNVKLTKKTPDGDFTHEDAIRVYLWNKHGYDVPGLTKTDQTKLAEFVMANPDLQNYAEALNVISKQDGYVTPTAGWEVGDIRTDLDDATGRVGREQFFGEFFENADIIFSQENLNKIEAAYGVDMVEAIKDMLYRTKTGRNRPQGQNKLVNKFLNYLNGSVGATMFFNIRSAVLQQMSMVNFINFADNNIFAAAKAFANQKQYWNDWATIFNSDFMKQRRGGIKTDVNGAELAASVKNVSNPVQLAIKKLLELGFLPTQIGDNIAIATGGSTFYRNRINTYLKQGLTQKEAESKAWVDFQVLAEATQQSARPDMVSQQQASPLGKVILAFQNVTSQFNRLGKKAFLDLKNRRITPGNPTQFQSDVSNISRIAYYFAIQNLIFYSLQSALFMAMFDDNEEDEKWLKKKERMINGSIDSVLRGSGVMGGVIATLKNMAIKWHLQRDKKYNPDESSVLMEMLNVSPPLGIKARKMVNAEKTLNYNKKVIDEMETFDIDNPMWSAYTSYIEALTNVPLNRLYNKTQNVRQSLNNQHTAFERALMFSGWSQWNLGIEDDKIKSIKEEIKLKEKLEKKKQKSKVRIPLKRTTKKRKIKKRK